MSDPMGADETVESLASALLTYFAGSNSVNPHYDRQPEYVKDLWRGAARVAIELLRDKR